MLRPRPSSTRTSPTSTSPPCAPHLEAEPKTGRLNKRLPQPQSLIHAAKARTAERGIPYQRLIREAIERAVRR